MLWRAGQASTVNSTVNCVCSTSSTASTETEAHPPHETEDEDESKLFHVSALG
jgi:hypothetical protein